MICIERGCFNLIKHGFRRCRACLLGFTPNAKKAGEEE
tara:strand:- start:1647 stop:1760 length:114 start_codon:yes stop_codon:yes gene_type:complete